MQLHSTKHFARLHSRLDLVESECDRGRGIGSHLQRVVLGIGHVRLITGRLAGAHLAVGEGDLES